MQGGADAQETQSSQEIEEAEESDGSRKAWARAAVSRTVYRWQRVLNPILSKLTV